MYINLHIASTAKAYRHTPSA